MRMSRRMGLLGKKKQLPTLAELFADMTVVDQTGYDSVYLKPSAIPIGRSPNPGTYPSLFAFAFCGEYFAVHYLEANGSFYDKTTLFRDAADTSATDLCEVTSNSKSFYLSEDGESESNVYGGSLLLAQFPSYTTQEVCAAFAEISIKASAGRNSQTKGSIAISKPLAGEFILTAYYGALSIATAAAPTTYIKTFNYEISSANIHKALNYETGSQISLSTDGTSSASVRGGTMVTI